MSLATPQQTPADGKPVTKDQPKKPKNTKPPRPSDKPAVTTITNFLQLTDSSKQDLKSLTDTASDNVCNVHRDRLLTKACTRCERVICGGCRIDSGDRCKHNYVLLEHLQATVCSDYKDLLMSANNKLKEMVVTEEAAIADAAQIEERCKSWRSTIDRASEKEHSRTDETHRKVADEIDQYWRTVSDEVSRIREGISARRKNLKDNIQVAQTLVNNGNITEMLKKKGQISTGLGQQIAFDDERFEKLESPALVVAEEKERPNTFLHLSSTLTFQNSTTETDSICYSAHFRADGNLLMSCDSGVKLLNRSTMSLTYYQTPFKDVTSYIESGHVAFALHRKNNNFQVDMCLLGGPPVMQLLEIKFAGKPIQEMLMTVSDRYLVVRDTQADQLIVLDLITKESKRQRVQISSHPYFLPDGQLLARKGNKLAKYKINDGVLKVIWISENLPKIDALTVDEDGIIYATIKFAKAICVISPTGEKLQMIQHSQLPAKAGQICLRGKTLAVPGLVDKRLYLFEINGRSSRSDS